VRHYRQLRRSRADPVPRAEPDAKDRDKLVDVDRFGDIIRGAGFDAFLAIAFHRLAVTAIIGSVANPGMERISCIV